MFKDLQVDKQVAKKCFSLKAMNCSLKLNSKTSLRKPDDLRDISKETSLINLPGGVSETCKSALFKMSLRRCMRRLRDASEMHPSPLGFAIVSSSRYN